MAAIEDGPKDRKVQLTSEERKQLLVHHISRLREKQAEVERLREPFKAAQEEFTGLVNEAKADLGKGYTRKHLTSLLEDSTSRLRDLLAEEQQRTFDREALGLPVFGIQPDLFDNAATPQEARDEIAWEAEGYLVGRRAGDRDPPQGCPPRFDQAFMRGWERGQEETCRLVAAGMELRKRQAEPNADAEPVDLQTDIEDALAPEAVEGAARKLKRSKFMERGEPEAAAA